MNSFFGAEIRSFIFLFFLALGNAFPTLAYSATPDEIDAQAATEAWEPVDEFEKELRNYIAPETFYESQVAAERWWKS